MQQYIEAVKKIIPDFSDTDTRLAFADVPIDSMDLASIRVAFERMAARPIPDSDWVSFETIDQIVLYCLDTTSESTLIAQPGNGNAPLRELTVEMPQMAVGALSENWLFKELGSLHWELLCAGLQTKSFELKDDLGNRLYATFVRIRIDASASLYDYKENEKIQIDGSINRFGGSMYFSNMDLQARSGCVRAKLMTTFSAREGADNTKLTKTQPSSSLRNSISEEAESPLFAEEYRRMRKAELKQISLGGTNFTLGSECLYETVYQLNPYYDLNGVGLLYFAAYPIINDVCEARHFNAKNTASRWEETYFTIARDIFYFGNCNISDQVIYKLHAFELIGDNLIATQSSLLRRSDDSPIARVFTVKKLA